MFFRKSFGLLKSPFVKTCQWHRTNSTAFKALKFSKFGQPIDVLELTEDKLEKPKGSQVLVKILASPINPADINIIQGKYPVKPPFPAVAGNECVAEVCALGEEAHSVKVGDRVIFIETNLGSWRTHALVCENQIATIPKEIDLAQAATLSVNPSTAYRMLKDFVNLQPGDTVIQNGGASAVGQYVIQLCKTWGINCVSTIRSGPRFEENKKILFDLGASEVLKEEETGGTKIFRDGKFKKPKLALNCIGGKSATDVARHLENEGTMVTFGGMSMKPVEISTSALIFKDQRFLGYWMTRWTAKNKNTPQQKEMFEDLFKLILEGKIKPSPYQFVPLEEYKNAEPALSLKSFGGKKAIFVMCP